MSAACILGVAYSGCNRTITVTLLTIGIAATGGIFGGVLVNLIDIAPNFAGLLMGVTNTAATIPGFLAPWTAGIIIDNDVGRQKFMSYYDVYIYDDFNVLIM